MKLSSLVYLVTLLGTLLLSVGLIIFLDRYSQAVVDRSLDRAVRVRAQSAALDLARTIDADWQELRHLEQQLRTLPEDELPAILRGMVGSGSRVAWIGYAGIDGRVVVASNGLLEGVDVSERPWFRAGLQGGYAGDVRESVLLNRVLGGRDTDPIRFLDLAVPVTGAEGRTVGVLAARIKAEWVEGYLTESAEIRGIDFYLVSASGEVAAATAATPERLQELQTFRAAAEGAATSIREQWPDGRTYQSAVLPKVGYGSLPSFGWRLVARSPADAFAVDRADVLRVALGLMAACVAVILVLAFVFVRMFVAPIERLADAAAAISRGEDVYPPELHGSREARSLSASLARLQSLARRHSPR